LTAALTHVDGQVRHGGTEPGERVVQVQAPPKAAAPGQLSLRPVKPLPPPETSEHRQDEDEDEGVEPATVVKQAQLEEAEDEGQATEDQEDEEDEEDVEDDEEDGAHQPTLTCAELLQQLNACHVGLEQARSAASQVRLQQQQLMRDMDGGACRSQLPWAWAEQL
jgi:hypothetical protein